MEKTTTPSADNKPTDQLSGPQGTDKWPTDDPADSQGQETDVQESQKAKKVDADPAEESKKPTEP
jgi:hypothetical protein